MTRGIFLDTSAPAGARPSLGPRTGFAENFEAARQAAVLAGGSVSELANMADAYDPLIEELNRDLPIGNQVGNPYARSLNDPVIGADWRRQFTTEEIEAEVWRRINQRREADPTFLADLPDRDALVGRVNEEARQAVLDYADISARARWTGVVGSIAGEGLTAMADPAIATTMLIGPASSVNILKAAVVDGLLAGLSEAAVVPDIARYRAELGVPLAEGEITDRILSAGGFGFLFGGLARGAVPAFRALRGQFEPRLSPGRAIGRELLEQIRAGELNLPSTPPALATARALTMQAAIQAGEREAVGAAVNQLSREEIGDLFDQVVTAPSSDQAVARQSLENELEIIASSPYELTTEGVNEHYRRLWEATDAIYGHQLPRLDDAPPMPLAPERVPATTVESLEGAVFSFDPLDLEVAADIFQFKGGADTAGVTDRLAGVTRWDPVKAGMVVVWERADGRLFVADGHQRVALARRLVEAGSEDRIRVFGYKLREVDDISAEEARVIAAAKNIAEGTGSAVDAARVLRIRPDLLESLPPRSALVRHGRDIAALSPEAEALIVSGAVPEHIGAIVGRLVEDPSLQANIMVLLSRLQPANATEAESMVRQALEAGTRKEIQSTLFGDEEVVSSLYLERAKVLSRALQKLRRDRSVFAALTRERSRVEEAGNVLDAAANERRATTDAAAIQHVLTLANRKGALSDALSAAARRAGDDGNFRGAVRDFVAAVRRAVDEGDFDRVDAGADGRNLQDAARAEQSAAAARAAADDAALDDFAEPAGPGQEAQTAELEREIQDQAENQPEAPAAEVPVSEPAAAGGEAADQVDAISAAFAADEALLQRALAKRRSNPHLEDIEDLDGAINKFADDLLDFHARPQTIESVPAEGLARRAENAFAQLEGNRGFASRHDLDKVIEAHGDWTVASERQAHLVLGPPAAGKSSAMVEPLLPSARALLLDADEAKKLLPEFEGGSGAGAVHEESSGISKQLLQRALDRGDNIVFPRVGDNQAKIERDIARFTEAGYTVHLYLVDLPADKVMQRALLRWVSTGRLLPPEFISSIGDRPKGTFHAVKNSDAIASYRAVTNDVAFGERPREIESSTRGAGETDLGEVEPDRGRGEADRGERPEPAAERAVEPQTERTEQGEQVLVPGVAPVTDRDRLAVRAGRPMGPGAAQRDLDIGIFDTAGREQTNLLDMAVPTGERVEDGDVIAEVVSVRDMLDGHDRDKRFIEQLETCAAMPGAQA